MLSRTSNNRLTLIVTILFVLMMASACEEIDVYTVSQVEEVERYLADSEICTELFRDHGLTGTITYIIPGNDTVYTDIVDSTKRSISVRLDPNELLNLGIGSYYYATATITNSLYGKLQKQISGRVDEVNFTRFLQRKAFLVKLGDNNQAYSGWLLQGVNLGDATRYITVATTSGDTLELEYLTGMYIGGGRVEDPNDDDYFDVDDIKTIEKGARITFDGCGKYQVLANYEASSGYLTENVTEGHTDSSCFSDSVLTSTATNYFWNSLFVRSFNRPNDSTLITTESFIPYIISD
ncbi:MAG: hypothetical protein JSU74_11125 [Candidatus Zixiibacteriota bacterium]|nr:MAG: hypothetical protein JSU74_11125 [candidate division Zixibacteria bacterium]